jgi:CHAD domain-containing protein
VNTIRMPDVPTTKPDDGSSATPTDASRPDAPAASSRTLIAAAATATPAADDPPPAPPPSGPDAPAASSRTLIAAAATATPAADDPPPAPPPPSREEREFRLHAGETVADGIRRAARGQLADSSAALAGAADRAELGAAVHGTRKSIKRVRTALRLSRDAIGAATYERENTELRAIAGRLADARDAQVLIETLRALEQRAGDELSPQTTQRLQARLEDDHGREIAVMAADGDLALTTGLALEQARARTAQWSFGQHGFGAVKPGLLRVYRRGRRGLRAACDEPTAENLHDVRKRVKDLWHASELLHAAHPKRMKRLARDAHELSGLLGDHHDLSVLRDYAQANPQLFSDMTARETLLAALDRRSETLQHRALKLGRQLYKRPPKRFVKDVARGWDKRVGSA